MSSVLTGLFPYPIVQAPMAGGVSLPPLAQAVSGGRGVGVPGARGKAAPRGGPGG